MRRAPRKILLVHRDERVRAEVQRILTAQGHQPTVAGHLVEAWAKLRAMGEQPPDVILLAPATPGEDRFRRSLGKHDALARVPVVELTTTLIYGLRDLIGKI